MPVIPSFTTAVYTDVKYNRRSIPPVHLPLLSRLSPPVSKVLFIASLTDLFVAGLANMFIVSLADLFVADLSDLLVASLLSS